MNQEFIRALDIIQEEKSIDKEEQRIMISVHYYSPWDFCGGENGVITQ